ncbi:MAG: glycosyl transferase [Methylophaga sp.]|nr:MAG: glycosyl transferase [Methylophaga sp.]
MKISIITVCYNASEFIRYAIESVLAQSYPDIEYIVIDGASNDGTLEIINEYSKDIKHIVSEPDQGIYDAMNKGLKMATGDIIGTLNADDFYSDNDVLNRVSECFRDESVDAVYADLVYVNQIETDKTVRLWKSRCFISGLFKQGWVPPHPTFFTRKQVYKNYGYFDLKYKLAADFELLFRMIEVNKIKTVYVPSILVKMRMGGATNKNITNIIQQNKEILLVLKAYYSDLSVINWFAHKSLDRFMQFVRSLEL